MRLIDADALERDGWRMSRIVQIDEKTMEAQTRKPTDFPTIEPERIRGHWIIDGEPPMYIKQCSVCGARFFYSYDWDKGKYCGECGADMRESQ